MKIVRALGAGDAQADVFALQIRIKVGPGVVGLEIPSLQPGDNGLLSSIGLVKIYDMCKAVDCGMAMTDVRRLRARLSKHRRDRFPF